MRSSDPQDVLSFFNIVRSQSRAYSNFGFGRGATTESLGLNLDYLGLRAVRGWRLPTYEHRLAASDRNQASCYLFARGAILEANTTVLNCCLPNLSNLPPPR